MYLCDHWYVIIIVLRRYDWNLSILPCGTTSILRWAARAPQGSAGRRRCPAAETSVHRPAQKKNIAIKCLEDQENDKMSNKSSVDALPWRYFFGSRVQALSAILPWHLLSLCQLVIVCHMKRIICCCLIWCFNVDNFIRLILLIHCRYIF